MVPAYQVRPARYLWCLMRQLYEWPRGKQICGVPASDRKLQTYTPLTRLLTNHIRNTQRALEKSTAPYRRSSANALTILRSYTMFICSRSNTVNGGNSDIIFMEQTLIIACSFLLGAVCVGFLLSSSHPWKLLVFRLPSGSHECRYTNGFRRPTTAGIVQGWTR